MKHKDLIDQLTLEEKAALRESGTPEIFPG